MPKNKTWRQVYSPKIAEMISMMKSEGRSVKEMKKILCDANPGEYGHMKKTWASEYMRQLGLSKRKGKSQDAGTQTLF